jgi:MFS family permease
MLATVFFARLSTGIQFQSIAAVAPVMVPDLHLSFAQLGWLIGLFSLPGIVVAFPGGAAGQRLGERWAAMVGLSLMAIGAVVIALAPTFLMAMVGRIVSGIGGIIVNLAFSKMIAGWFAGKEMATAMGVMLTAWPVGMGLALLTLGSLAETHSWRIGIGASALAAVVALASIVAIYRDPARPADATSDLTTARSSRLSRAELTAAVMAGLAWTALNASLFVFVSFAPGVLVVAGYSVARAGLIVSIALWMTLVSMPVGGYLADRTKRNDQMVAGGAIAMAACMVAFIWLPAPAVWCLIGGIVVGAAPGPAMSLLPRVVSQERLSSALGVYYSVFYAGAAMLQPLAGFFLDLSGWPAAPILVAAIVMASTVVPLMAFRAMSPRLLRRE